MGISLSSLDLNLFHDLVLGAIGVKKITEVPAFLINLVWTGAVLINLVWTGAVLFNLVWTRALLINLGAVLFSVAVVGLVDLINLIR